MAELTQYELLQELTAGPEGVVKVARDPRLSRQVLIWLPRPGAAAERVLGAARKLAQAPHPGLLAVHDLGDGSAQPFVATERIEGTAFPEWRQGKPTRTVLKAVIELGEALSALHAQGSSHGDLREADVRVDAGGRARLADLGWARTEAAGGDARSDQRAFAALAAGSLGASDLTNLSGLPARQGKALQRALSDKPEDRWPSIAPLLAELRPGLRSPVARVATVAAFVALAGVAGLLLLPRLRPCRNLEAEWGDAWSPAVASQVQASFSKTGSPAAPRAFAAVSAALGDYRQRWVQLRTAACQDAVKVGKKDDGPRLRVECLQERRGEAAALAKVLAESDAAAVAASPRTVAQLGSLAQCENAAALRRKGEPPQDSAGKAELESIQAAAARAKALEAAGRYPEGAKVAAAAVEPARKLGYEPLLAEVLYRRGRLEEKDGRLVEAQRTLEEAAKVALSAGNDGALADIWTHLSYVVGSRLQEKAQGEQCSEYARAAIERLGGDDLREAIRLQRLLNIIFSVESRARETVALLARQQVLFDRTDAPPLIRADRDAIHAQFLTGLGQLDEALPLWRKATEARQKALGDRHPIVWASMVGEAMTLGMAGRLEEGRKVVERMDKMTDDRCTGQRALLDILKGHLHRADKQFQAALEADERALKCLKPMEPNVTRALTGKGTDLVRLGRPAEAIEPLERALAARQKGGRDSEDLSDTQAPLAEALWDSGRDRVRALSLYRASRDTLARYVEQYPTHGRKARLEKADTWLATHGLQASAASSGR